MVNVIRNLATVMPRFIVVMMTQLCTRCASLAVFFCFMEVLKCWFPRFEALI